MTMVCINDACPEFGVVKHGLPGNEWPPDLVVHCGVCGEPCEQRDPDGE